MSSKNNNKLNIPEAREAMNQFKMEAANERSIFFRQKLSHRHLIKPENVLLCNLAEGIGNKFQALFHAEYSVFAFVDGSIPGQNFSYDVPGGVDLLDGKGGYDLIFHSLQTESSSLLRIQEQFGCG